MTTGICRVCVAAKPAKTHREFEPFETANIVIFMKADAEEEALAKARAYLSTREVLGNPNLKGGIIFLNSGYGSFPPEEFGPLVERYVRKDTKQSENDSRRP